MRELILTGVKEFWPKDESNALFLGPWCFAHNDKHDFCEQTKFSLAPSSWKEYQEISKALEYINSLIDRIIPKLSDTLNRFYGIEHSDKFWKIYLIEWLVHWLGILYDRYQRLSYLNLNSGEKLSVKILDRQAFIWGATSDCMKKAYEDHYYNLFFMSDILRHSSFDSFFIESHSIQIPLTRNFDRKWLKQSLRSSLDSLMEKTFNTFSRSSVYLGRIYGMSYLDKFYIQSQCNLNSPFKIQRMEKLRSLNGDKSILIEQPFEFGSENEFESIVEKLIFSHFPEEILNIYESSKNKMPAKIWIGNDIYHSHKSAFKIARTCENGGRWISAQHGGGYADIKSLAIGKIEFDTPSGFVTWGWTKREGCSSQFYPLPSPMLSKLPKYECRKEQAVMVGTVHPPYFYRLHSRLRPEDLLAYFQNKSAFLHGIDTDILPKIKYRPNLVDYGTGELAFVQKFLSSGQILKKCVLTKEFAVSKLAIIDHMDTTYLEALSMNVPTILFWNPEHFVTASNAVSHIDKLKKAGIYFDSPESAAKKVNDIWDDVAGWWNQADVQSARTGFCNEFALTSKGWRNEWAQFLKNSI